jgi:hypothetical protein
VPLLERALALREHGSPDELGETAFTLAQALATSGGDRSRALGLAKRADEAYRAAGDDYKKQRAAVEAWLHKQPR